MTNAAPTTDPLTLSTRAIGLRSDTFTHHVDARWTMAYAAALGERAAIYFDTTGNAARAANLPDDARVLAHPCFPVCLEWPVILDSRAKQAPFGLTPVVGARAVHATHDLELLRPLRADEALRTHAEVIALEARRPGAYQLTRLLTLDANDQVVARTWQGTLFRGVGVHEDASHTARAGAPPALPDPDGARPCEDRFDVQIHANAAHVYTECARIWNPIHTDRKAAIDAGLPDIILHGTATLAFAISQLLGAYLANAPQRVRRLGCRFSGMVAMPSSLALHVNTLGRDGLRFTVQDEHGNAVLSAGFVQFDAA